MESVVSTFKNIVWCDITTVLEELIRQRKTSEGTYSPTYLLDDPSNLELDVRTIGTDETRAMTVSRSRNLVVTIDGVHPNGIGAQAIAASITAALPW
jgi:lysophospholipase L1-like esterase